MMYRGSRQNVTGLVVNEKINVAWEYRHTARAMVHKLVTTGQFDILKATRKEDGQIILETRSGKPDELHGRLGFIDSVDFANNTEAGGPSKEFSSRESTYRLFLFYITFYAATSPVLICEGKTDNVYLTHAIRSLAKEFTALAEPATGGRIQLKIRIYKYPKTSTARLLELKSGGSSTLSKFIAAYPKVMARFGGTGLAAPVIVIYDKDDGAKPIEKAIYNVSKVKVTGTEPFIHIVKNLYAVATPTELGKQSRIEDFFDAQTRATVIDGKTFSVENDFDTDRCYGKIVFAHKVIKPNADTIDFTGFRPLLANIVAVITHHKQQSPKTT